MSFQEFKYLLRKFKTNQYTLSDLKKLDEQLKDRDQVRDWMSEELESLVDKEYQSESDYENLFHKIESKIHSRKRIISLYNKDSFKKIIQVAAIIIFVFFTGGLASYFIFKPISISKDQETYCEFVTPYGAKSELVLPDGSIVSLNAGSSLRYSTDFNVTNRDLILTGEAYFDVSKNKELPFMVNALGLKITALGTEFNVKAYEEEETIETTLIEGKVTLESEIEEYKFSDNVYLLPNQKAILSKKKNELKVEGMPQDEKYSEKRNQPKLMIVKKIDTFSEIAWKDNQLIFHGEELSKIVVKLERRFNVHFNYEMDDIKHYKFSGTLKEQTLQQVLDVIQLSAPINYSLDGNEVILAINPERVNIYEKQLKKSIQ